MHHLDIALPAALLAHAQSLASLGVAEAGWPRSAALAVLDHLRGTLERGEGQAVAVLGGDVLRLTDGVPRYTYDNWHTDPLPGEPFATYAARSHAATRTYLERYPDVPGQHLYTLVLADRLPDAG